MRRLLIVLIAFSFAGMVVAAAGGFSTTAAPLSSFTATSVSISVPSTSSTTVACTAIGAPILLRTVGNDDVLHPVPPTPALEGLTSRELNVSFGTSVEDQTSNNRYISWDVVAPEPCGYRLDGIVRLFLDTSYYSISDIQLRARMFLCLLNASPHSKNDCTPLGDGSAGTTIAGGDSVTQVNLGTITVDVPAGMELRLKVIAFRSASVSITSPPVFGWGYVDANPDFSGVSRLTVTPP